MRVNLDIRKRDDGWDVLPSIEAEPADVLAGAAASTPVIDPETGTPWRRALGRVGTDPLWYPLPPEADVLALGADATHCDLCSAKDVTPLVAVHQTIVDRNPPADAMRRVGRYLFETLIGGRLWDALVTQAAGAPIQLAVECDWEEQSINKLPWEMMRTADRYLAQMPGVSIVRRIRDASAPPQRPLHSPPRVLFVVGTGLDDDVIRPGAEYLRLLMALRARGTEHRLQTRIVQLATPAKTQAAIIDFEPDVVHFICHGWHDASGKGYLELVDGTDPRVRLNVFPAGLLQILRTASNLPLPHVVVLSACYSASVDPAVGQLAAPIAAELVHNGVPVVVGMSGRVSDQACRLFTRRFYEALLDREDVARATAEGRLAALAEGGVDPEAGVDWTLPTLYVTGDRKWRGLDIPEPALPDEWFGGAAEYGTGPHPVFCDRLDLFERFDILLARTEEQRVLTGRPTGIQVLAISVDISDTVHESERLGRTWLLREFAAKAAREGHLPCLVEPRDLVEEPLNDLRSLLECLTQALRDTQRNFRLAAPAAPSLQLLRGLNAGDPIPAGAHAEIRDVSPTYDPASTELYAVALRLDLLRMLEQVRAARVPHSSPARLILLIDDLHRMGANAVRSLLFGLLGTAGLRHARDDIRIVLSYSTAPVTGQEATKKAVDDWLGEVTWVEQRKLEPFRSPVEELIAYQHYLLNWFNDESRQNWPLTVNERSPLYEVFANHFSKGVKGIPYRLKPGEQASQVIQTYLDISKALNDNGVLRPADDEDRLQLVRVPRGPGNGG
jgi:hypothetical protein